MKHKCKMAVAALLVLALLLSTPLLGCGDEDEKEDRITITIGMLTDLTGPAGPALVPLLWALQDQIKYINEEDPIPGAQLEVITYDTKMDAARGIPGYEWLKERGSEVIVTIFDYDAAALMPFAEKDKIPLVSLIVSEPLLEPGWVFCVNSAMPLQMAALLEWIGEQSEPSEEVLKIGCIAPFAGAGIEAEEKLREYCQDHSDEFDYVEGFLVPFTTMSWPGEVEKLKDCDWIAFAGSTGMNVASFVEQFRGKGYTTAKFFGQEGVASFWGYVTDKVGFEALDGSVFWVGAAWWSDPYPVVDFLKGLLHEYHQGEADKIMRESIGYIGGGVQTYFFLQILQQAIESVGAENFDGQAFYDTAVKFKITMEGFEEWGFSATKRYCQDHGRIHEVNAETEDLEIVGDWVPLLTD